MNKKLETLIVAYADMPLVGDKWPIQERSALRRLLHRIWHAIDPLGNYCYGYVEAFRRVDGHMRFGHWCKECGKDACSVHSTSCYCKLPDSVGDAS